MLWACLMGIQPADSAGQRLRQCSILSVAARHWLISVIKFLGDLTADPKDISTASVRPVPLHKRQRVDEPVLN